VNEPGDRESKMGRAGFVMGVRHRKCGWIETHRGTEIHAKKDRKRTIGRRRYLRRQS
jgi:hypothetical protein